MKLDKYTANKRNLRMFVDMTGDRYFDLEEISFSQDTGEWKLSFGESDRGPFENTLKISGVMECHYSDPYKIGIYQMNTIKVDLERLVIRLKAEPGLDIALKVDEGFTISLE